MLRVISISLSLWLISLQLSADDRSFELYVEQHDMIRPDDVVRLTGGDQAILRWHSDLPVELHLHGYDILLEVEAGKPGEMRFECHTSGRFPVTSYGSGQHQGHATLLYVEIYPE